MTASNMTINTSNLPTLPLAFLPPPTDNSSKIATTEWVQSLFSTGDVSSILLNGDLETYVVEEGVRFLDIMIIGRGGLAGITNSAGGVDYYGGAGGGGCIVFTNKFYVQKDQQFQLDINSNGGVILKFMRKPGSGTFETIATVTQASEGSPGNTSGAAAAGGGSATPSVPSTYCTWTYILGTTGGSGTTNPPSAAGYPKSRYFQEGAAGSGQLTPSGPISNGNIVLVAYK
jgi:hypothetical protein